MITHGRPAARMTSSAAGRSLRVVEPVGVGESWVPVRRPGPGLALLLGGADEHFVDRDVPGAGDDVADGVGDVFSIHTLAELAADALQYLGAVVAGEFGGGGARLDQG